MTVAYIQDMAKHEGQEVTLRGWLYNRTPKGKLQFLVVRDGTGMIQAVAFRPDVGEEVWARCESLTQESSIIVTGAVRKDRAPPAATRCRLKSLEVVQVAEEYPIALKEHGIGFLMEHRHLWLRSTRQHAILEFAPRSSAPCRDFLDDQGFTLVDTPDPDARRLRRHQHPVRDRLLRARRPTSARAASSTTRPPSAPWARTYCFGPTFRAEKSKTRRHLMEFWMVEPEAAYYTQEDNMELAGGHGQPHRADRAQESRPTS